MFLTQHFQNAYVTADLDRAVAVLADQFGGPEKPPMIEANSVMTTPDGDGEAKLRLAFIQIGGLQYELIQPVSGNVALYADALRADQLMTLHHVAMRADDFDTVRAENERHGRRIAMWGESRGIRFMYVDARATLGHYLEYVRAPQSFWDRLSA